MRLDGLFGDEIWGLAVPPAVIALIQITIGDVSVTIAPPSVAASLTAPPLSAELGEIMGQKLDGL